MKWTLLLLLTIGVIMVNADMINLGDGTFYNNETGGYYTELDSKLPLERAIFNKTYINEIRSTDTIEKQGTLTKYYNATDKKILVQDKNITILDMRLESPYLNHVNVGTDILIAEFELHNYSQINTLFENISLFNSYSSVEKRVFNFKYKVLNETCDEKICRIFYTWHNFTTLKDLPKLDIIIGIYTTTYYNEVIEWVGSIKGFNILEWATWQTDTYIIRGLTDIGGYSTISVFNKDSTWYLIAGETSGSFYGFNLSSTLSISYPTWTSYSNITGGLIDIGAYSHPSVFYKDTTWYLIAGNESGMFTGFNWSGSDWQLYPTIVGGLPDIGTGATPNVFYKDSTWYLIAGNYTGMFSGYNWSGTTWERYNNITGGLGDVGDASSCSIFYMDSTWYLIAGQFTGDFEGFNWTGTTWQSYPYLVTDSGDVGTASNPSVFYIYPSWYMISGEGDGVFNGWELENNYQSNINFSLGVYNYTHEAQSGLYLNNASINGTYVSSVFQRNASIDMNMLNITLNSYSWSGYEVQGSVRTNNWNCSQYSNFSILLNFDTKGESVITNYCNTSDVSINTIVGTTNVQSFFENKGQALKFDGDNDRVKIPYNDRFNCSNIGNKSEVSFGFWYNQSSYTDGNNIPFVRSSGNIFDIRFMSDNMFDIAIAIDEQAGNDFCLDIGSHSLNNITHFVFVRNFSGTFVYKNGLFDGSCTDDRGILTAWDASDLYLGADLFNVDDFNGTLDEVFFMCSQLTASQVLNIYKGLFNWSDYAPYQSFSSGQDTKNYSASNATTFYQAKLNLYSNASHHSFVYAGNVTQWNYTYSSGEPAGDCWTVIDTKNIRIPIGCTYYTIDGLLG